jgi:hypothetical protein
MRVVSCATVQTGDDDALAARAPRYHPACRAFAWPLDSGCDGPTRSVLLSQGGCSSEGSPVMAGSTPIQRFYEDPQSGHTPRGRYGAELRLRPSDPLEPGLLNVHSSGLDFEHTNAPQRRVHVTQRNAQQARGAIHQRVAGAEK